MHQRVGRSPSPGNSPSHSPGASPSRSRQRAGTASSPSRSRAGGSQPSFFMHAISPTIANVGGQPYHGMSFEEVKQAFQFLDASGRGVLRPKDLRAKLAAFYPELTPKDYKFLIPDNDFTVEKLWALLENNDLGNFDPVRDAFRIYDPADTGFMDTEALRSILMRMGYGDVTFDDVSVLIQAADCDGDGRVSLEDFRNMLDFQKRKEEEDRRRQKQEQDQRMRDALAAAEGNTIPKQEGQ